MKKGILILGVLLIIIGLLLNFTVYKEQDLGNKEEEKKEEKKDDKLTPSEPADQTEEETTDDDESEESSSELLETHDYKEDINCVINNNKSIYDIYHFDIDENAGEAFSWTAELTSIGTHLPKDLDSDVTSYFLMNSGVIDCSVVEHNNDPNKKYKQDEVIASIKEDDMKNMIEKIYGVGNYKRYDWLTLGSKTCFPWEFNKKNSEYELKQSFGCGFPLGAEYFEFVKKEIKTSGDNTIITEYINDIDGDGKTTKLKIEYTVRTKDKVLIKIVTSKV